MSEYIIKQLDEALAEVERRERYALAATKAVFDQIKELLQTHRRLVVKRAEATGEPR